MKILGSLLMRSFTIFDHLTLADLSHLDSFRFKEEGVKDVLKDVFLPWFNAYRFLMQNIDTYNADVVSEADKFMWSEDSIKPGQGGNVMDRWIISFTQSLLKFVHKEMAAYRLYTVLPR